MLRSPLFELVKLAISFITVVAVCGYILGHGTPRPIPTDVLAEASDAVAGTYHAIVNSLTETYNSVVGSITGLISLEPLSMDRIIPVDKLITATLSPDNTGTANPIIQAVPTAEAINSTPSITQEPTVSPRPGAFSINVAGGGAHKAGETLHLYGENACSDTVYLFVRGLGVPLAGARLNDMRAQVIDGRPETFTAVKVKPDGSWQYEWTPAPGQWALTFRMLYVIAEVGPRDSNHLDATSRWAMAGVKIETT